MNKFILQFEERKIEIWANTFWNWLHGLSAPPSPAFTLYRVTFVIGSPSIKSLLNLIATIAPILFLNSTLECQFWVGWNLTWFCVKYFKREKNLQISQDWPLEAALELSFHSWIKTNQIGPFTLRVIFSDHMAHFSTFPFALFWGV